MKQLIAVQGKFSEEACMFTCGGDAVKALLTTPPAGTAVRGAVVFSHGWSGFRSGPAGILAFLAREFARNGFVSLRFDYRGRGESGGNGIESSLVTMADDLVAAVNFLASRGYDHPALCGLCSGGNVVIGTLKRIPTASKLLLLSVYPFSDGDAFGRDVHRSLHYLNVYLHKLFRPDTWKRLVCGDIRLASVANVIFGHFFRKNANRKKEGLDAPADARKLPQAVKAAAVEGRTQGSAAPQKHLANLRNDLPGIMVYGTADPDAPAAIQYYGEYIHEHALPIQIESIDGANHNFTSPGWRQRVLSLLLDKLNG